MVGALGMSCRRVEGRLMTSCPACESPMEVGARGFVCSGTKCLFWTGDSLDLAAHVLGSYEQALDVARTLIPNWVTAQEQGRAWQDIRREQAEDLRRLRAVTDFLIQRADQPVTMARNHARMMCRKHMMDPQSMPRAIYALTASEARELYLLFGKVVPQPEAPGEYNYAALVFFRDPYRICKVQLFPLVGGTRPIRFITFSLFPSRFSFLGLHDLVQRDRAILYQNYLLAVRENFSHVLGCKGNRLGVSLDTTCSNKVEWPKAHAMVVDADSEPLITALGIAQRECAMGVIVRDEGTELPFMSWDQFIVRWLLDKIAAAPDPAVWMGWLDSACLTPDMRAKVLLRARNELSLSLFHRITDLFGNRAIHQEDRVTLMEANDVYFAKRRAGATEDQRIEVANFTITLTRNIHFRDSGDTYHEGEIRCAGETYLARISAQASDNLSQLESEIRTAVMRGASPHSQKILPVIREKNLAKMILTVLRNQMASLPSIEGISRLGWSVRVGDKLRQQFFQAPDWVVTADGVTDHDAILHPDTIPAVFGSSSVEDAEALQAVPSDLCSLTARIVATIARGGLNEPLRPLLYSDGMTTRAALLKAFSVLGQREVFDLSFGGQGGRQLEFLRAFPVVISGLNVSQVSRVTQPIFVIGDGPAITSEVPAGYVGFLREAVRSTVLWVMSGAEGYQRAPAVLYEEQLEREGEFIIRKVMGRTGWPGSSRSFQNLERWLSGATADQLEQILMLDAQTHMVALPPAASTPEIEIECRARANHVERRGDSLHVDAASLQGWLLMFYGRDLKVRVTNLPVIPQ